MQYLRDCYWIRNAKICGKIGHRLNCKNVHNAKIVKKGLSCVRKINLIKFQPIPLG